jgi:hypothetical protein
LKYKEKIMAKKKADKPKAATKTKKAAHAIVPVLVEDLGPVEQVAEHFDVKDLPLPEPEPTPPPIADPYHVDCEVKSIAGPGFFREVAIVVLKAIDGKDLLDLLRKGQRVTLHYYPPQPATQQDNPPGPPDRPEI